MPGSVFAVRQLRRNSSAHAPISWRRLTSRTGAQFPGERQAVRVRQDLQRRNLVVPVVGNFAGPKTLRAIANYVRRNGARVSAFYVSNVEEYLRQDGVWQAFCGNLASLPIDESSAFIRAVRLDPLNPAVEGFATRLSRMAPDIRQCSPPR